MVKEKFNFDTLFNVDCWQNDFRKAANKIMAKGDRKKIPICIPSYGRPDAKFFIHLANDFTETKNYPIHVFVRDSQIKDYENSFENLESIGSGFIISEDGYIITNNHFIGGY